MRQEKPIKSSRYPETWVPFTEKADYIEAIAKWARASPNMVRESPALIPPRYPGIALNEAGFSTSTVTCGVAIGEVAGAALQGDAHRLHQHFHICPGLGLGLGSSQ